MRETAVRLLMRGEATPSEIVEAAGVTRQLVYYWCKAAGIVGQNAEARKAHVRGLLSKGMLEPATKPAPTTKAKMRKIADRAKAQWDKRNAEKSKGLAARPRQRSDRRLQDR